jgi:ADP-ribose pyrophosphatase YjhB (NUDIX family)
MKKPQDNLLNYPRPSVATDIVVLTIAEEDGGNYRKLANRSLELLLVKRGIEPFRGRWALPGGFVRPGEDLRHAAGRELAEETGASGIYLEQLYTFSDPARDPRSWVISCAYIALVPKSRIRLHPGTDAENAAWFRVEYETPESGEGTLALRGEGRTITAAFRREDGFPKSSARTDLAFDHADIIACAIERLRGKLDYTDIALNMANERFTLSELQQIYEVILGKKLLAAAFRRKVSGLVAATDAFTQNEGHRPSRIFRRR